MVVYSWDRDHVESKIPQFVHASPVGGGTRGAKGRRDPPENCCEERPPAIATQGEEIKQLPIIVRFSRPVSVVIFIVESSAFRILVRRLGGVGAWNGGWF